MSLSCPAATTSFCPVLSCPVLPPPALSRSSAVLSPTPAPACALPVVFGSLLHTFPAPLSCCGDRCHILSCRLSPRVSPGARVGSSGVGTSSGSVSNRHPRAWPAGEQDLNDLQPFVGPARRSTRYPAHLQPDRTGKRQDQERLIPLSSGAGVPSPPPPLQLLLEHPQLLLEQPEIW